MGCLCVWHTEKPSPWGEGAAKRRMWGSPHQSRQSRDSFSPGRGHCSCIRKLLSLLLVLLLLAGCVYLPPMETTAETEPPVSPALTVTFLDVGQADCALIQCGEEFLLIDGGNVADSRLVVAFLEEMGVSELRAVVCTHAHEDHVGGLPGVLAVYPVDAVYAPTRTYSSACFDDFVYYVNQQDLEIQIPAPGDVIALGDARITVLGPVKSYPEQNNTSIVLRVDYGETAFLFTGDMETEAEADMLAYWGPEYDWDTDVLKAGHHGSSTSGSYAFIRAVAPEYGVVSCGKDNDYGHPHRETVAMFRDEGIRMLRTDELGTVTAVSDGRAVTVSWENSGAAPAEPEPVTKWIGNRNSLVYHRPDCDGLPAEKNRVIFDSRAAAEDAGFTPCGRCTGR